METRICPSTLAEGFATYSPTALKSLFDGQRISHILPYDNPEEAGIQTLFNDSRKTLSLSGAQSKYPIVLEEGRMRLARAGEQSTHILKPRLTDFSNGLYGPANEHLTMQIAAQVYGIKTAANGLCFFGNGEAAYITRRYDIAAKGKLQQEDMASVAGITTMTHGANFKYDALSYEDIASVIRQNLVAWRIEMVRYYELVLFNFLFCNGDAHLKNFSIVRRESGDYALAPAYDLINTQLHIPDDAAFALSRGLFAGSDQHKVVGMTTGHTFRVFGERIGLPEKVVAKTLDKFSAEYKSVEDLVAHSFLSPELQKTYLDRHSARRRRLLDMMVE